MKTKTLIALALCIAIPSMVSAKKPKKEVVEEQPVTVVEDEEPVITEECVANVSLVHESVKNKQFADAYEVWLDVYTHCPNANKSIYTNGAKILDWRWENAKDETEKEQIRKMVMAMYDRRIKYFGNDPKYPAAYILGEKGLEYCEHFDNDPLKEPAYGWLKESVQKMGKSSKLAVITKFFEVSLGLYKSDNEKYQSQFMEDYSLASSLLQQIWDDPASKNSTAAAQQKDYVDNLFAASGAASCDKLDELYAHFIETNGQYLEDMLKLMKLYRRVGCTESEVYFAAAAAAHKLQPTEESAAGCAKMCAKKEDWKGAIDYYKQALSLVEDEADDDIDDYYLAMAKICLTQLKNYSEARTYARLALDANPHQGDSYLIIGMAYASSKPYSASDMPAAKAAILNKTVFWVAVDQFVKAKQIDPSCADDANKLINMYSPYYPTKEERFDLPAEFGQGRFFVGGWIGEWTTCR